MKPTVEIIVSRTGALHIDALGFKGADCEKATRLLEEALGVRVNRARKPEYHQRRQANLQQKIGK